jgi:hypothetical protein
VKSSRMHAARFAAMLVAASAAPAQAEVIAGTTIGWSWPGYGIFVPIRYGPYGFGWVGPWLPCNAGPCIDNPYLRRAIQRELALFEYRNELEERSQRVLQSYGRPPYGARGDLPPPTPEAQVQPAYRGSGEIRLEFSGTGQPRQEFEGTLR